MAAGRRRKRYLLLTGVGVADEDTRKELTRLILERYPTVDRKKIVWLENGVILRTDAEHLPAMKYGQPIRVGDVSIAPALSSGSISKLKRMAARSEGEHGRVL